MLLLRAVLFRNVVHALVLCRNVSIGSAGGVLRVLLPYVTTTEIKQLGLQMYGHQVLNSNGNGRERGVP